MEKYLEFGEIANTHGVKGGVKIDVWADDEKAIDGVKKLYIKEKNGYTELKIRSVSHFKGRAIVFFEGYDDIDGILQYKGKTVWADRDDLEIDEGAFFISDLIGLPVFDCESGTEYGRLTDVLNYGASDIYEIKDGRKHEYLVPAVDEFIDEILLEDGEERKAGIYIRPIKGMMDDVNGKADADAGDTDGEEE